MDSQRYVPLGYEQISDLSAATNLTAPSGATDALIVAETEAVRYRDDGTAPTADAGFPAAVGASFWYSGTLSAIQFIEQTSSAALSVLYYKRVG